MAGEVDVRRVGKMGVRDAYLAMLQQYTWRDLRIALHELEYRILCNFRACGGEVNQRLEARVGFSKYGVAVSGDHLAGFEGGPEVVFD